MRLFVFKGLIDCLFVFRGVCRLCLFVFKSLIDSVCLCLGVFLGCVYLCLRFLLTVLRGVSGLCLSIQETAVRDG